MIARSDAPSRCTILLTAALILCASPGRAPASDFQLVYAFAGGSDGAGPADSPLILKNGDIFGTTYWGGGYNGNVCDDAGCGTVFKLAADGTETILHAFEDGSDGANPYSSVIADAKGNLYGTTSYGGGDGCDNAGCGTVFEITAGGSFLILRDFAGGSDGRGLYAGLLLDKSGNLYGTTLYGGSTACGIGCGTVFRITPDGTESVLHAFAGGKDGEMPFGTLILDAHGGLYGTTAYGGGSGCFELGCGTLFRLAPDGTEKILHAFSGNGDGATPQAGVIMDAHGNLYGTTTYGAYPCDDAVDGCGVVFELAANGRFVVLHEFMGGKDGFFPSATPVLDGKGNVYGTTSDGGSGNGSGCDEEGCGIIFKIAPSGTESILHTFTGGSDGFDPAAGLASGQDGELYGTAYGSDNGEGNGVVYRIKK